MISPWMMVPERRPESNPEKISKNLAPAVNPLSKDKRRSEY
jgi:hypothetical protein